MEAYIVIDYTNDFIHNQGTLSLKERGQAIEDEVMSFIEQGKQSCVIFLNDGHTLNDTHTEFDLFPYHNIEGTFGAENYGKTHDIDVDAFNEVLVVHKTRYSGFFETQLDEILKQRNIDTIHLAGVCTELCVLQTAVDAYYRNYHIVVHDKACAALSDEAQTWAIHYMKQYLGATVKEDDDDLSR